MVLNICELTLLVIFVEGKMCSTWPTRLMPAVVHFECQHDCHRARESSHSSSNLMMPKQSDAELAMIVLGTSDACLQTSVHHNWVQKAMFDAPLTNEQNSVHQNWIQKVASSVMQPIGTSPHKASTQHMRKLDSTDGSL